MTLLPYLCTKGALDFYASMRPAPESFEIRYSHYRMGGYPTIAYKNCAGEVCYTIAGIVEPAKPGLEGIVEPHVCHKAICVGGKWRISDLLLQMAAK